MNVFEFRCDEWITNYVTADGAMVVKCLRCGRSHTEPPVPPPCMPPLEAVRIRCQNFANEHGDCLGET